MTKDTAKIKKYAFTTTPKLNALINALVKTLAHIDTRKNVDMEKNVTIYEIKFVNLCMMK